MRESDASSVMIDIEIELLRSATKALRSCTRIQMLCAAVEMLCAKRTSKPAKKHGNMPL